MAGYFDIPIILWLKHLAGDWWIFNYSIYCLSDNHLLKGGIFLAVFWGVWFRTSGDQTRTRTLLLSALAGGLLAIALNQAVLMMTPFRPRPYVAHLPGIDFPFNLGIAARNSFPSDHAALFFALATGLWFISRRMGIAACLYTAIAICIPRIYLGLHYPSDLMAGAVIGIASACLVSGTRLREVIARPLLNLETKYPAAFYAAFFVFTYQLATLFDDLRALGHWLHAIARVL